MVHLIAKIYKSSLQDVEKSVRNHKQKPNFIANNDCNKNPTQHPCTIINNNNNNSQIVIKKNIHEF